MSFDYEKAKAARNNFQPRKKARSPRANKSSKSNNSSGPLPAIPGLPSIPGLPTRNSEKPDIRDKDTGKA